LKDGKWNNELTMGILADEWRTEATHGEPFAEPMADCNTVTPAVRAPFILGA
jgi:hypothetical protein